MQKNAFHEIWTLLSRKVLREIRVCDCNKVQETPSFVFTVTFRFHFFEGRTEPGFHFRFLPKVFSTIINPGVKFLDLFIWKNIRETTLLTE